MTSRVFLVEKKKRSNRRSDVSMTKESLGSSRAIVLTRYARVTSIFHSGCPGAIKNEAVLANNAIAPERTLVNDKEKLKAQI